MGELNEWYRGLLGPQKGGHRGRRSHHENKPPHPPELPDGTHSNPQWRKQHTHICIFQHIVSHTYEHTCTSNTNTHLEEELLKFSFKQLLNHNSPDLCKTKVLPLQKSVSFSFRVLQRLWCWLIHRRYQQASRCLWNVSPYGCRDT